MAAMWRYKIPNITRDGKLWFQEIGNHVPGGCFITAFPPKSWEGNVFVGVCLSVCKEGPSCDHYPWFIGPHCTGTPSQRHGTSWEPLLVTSGGHLFRPIQTCRLGSPLELTSDGEACTISTSRCHSSYCKAFFILTDFEVKNISCILLHLNVSESRLKTKVIRSRASWETWTPVLHLVGAWW